MVIQMWHYQMANMTQNRIAFGSYFTPERLITLLIFSVLSLWGYMAWLSGHWIFLCYRKASFLASLNGAVAQRFYRLPTEGSFVCLRYIIESKKLIKIAKKRLRDYISANMSAIDHYSCKYVDTLSVNHSPIRIIQFVLQDLASEHSRHIQVINLFVIEKSER